MELDAFYALRSQAYQSGASREGLLGLKWDLSLGCEDPHTSVNEGRLSDLDHVIRARRAKKDPGELINPKQYVDLVLPCRRCSICLKNRQRLWWRRANDEFMHSSRTWFCTFTINPTNRALMKMRASVRLRARSVNFDTLDLPNQFSELHREAGKLFTNYFKRLRKKTGAKIRYLLVAEQHSDGFPHYHALIHERGIAVTKRDLEGEWAVGFTHFKLTDKHSIGYVTKYLSKSLMARVRASIQYGRAACTVHELLSEQRLDPPHQN